MSELCPSGGNLTVACYAHPCPRAFMRGNNQFSVVDFITTKSLQSARPDQLRLIPANLGIQLSKHWLSFLDQLLLWFELYQWKQFIVKTIDLYTCKYLSYNNYWSRIHELTDNHLFCTVMSPPLKSYFYFAYCLSITVLAWAYCAPTAFLVLLWRVLAAHLLALPFLFITSLERHAHC